MKIQPKKDGDHKVAMKTQQKNKKLVITLLQ